MKKWPKFGDGMDVEIGDEIVSMIGTVVTVERIEFSSKRLVIVCSDGFGYRYEYGEIVKRPDTQERIDEDARKPLTDYWGCEGIYCDKCPAKIDGKNPLERYDVGTCTTAQTLDLLRRQRELDGKVVE